MANGVWWVFLTAHIELFILTYFFCLTSQTSLCSFVNRSQCYVLLVSCLPHLSQLGPSEETDVLAGPKPALCHTGSWYHGEEGVKTLWSEASEQAQTTSNTILCVVRSQNGGSDGSPSFEDHFCHWIQMYENIAHWVNNNLCSASMIWLKSEDHHDYKDKNGNFLISLQVARWCSG